jgi:CcmD family protein
MGYLAAAYAVFWGVTFVFIYSLVARQRKIQKELELLEQFTREEAKSE